MLATTVQYLRVTHSKTNIFVSEKLGLEDEFRVSLSLEHHPI